MIKVEGSPINHSDRIKFLGLYLVVPLPTHGASKAWELLFKQKELSSIGLARESALSQDLDHGDSLLLPKLPLSLRLTLKKEGAKHVIITKGDWQEGYKAAINEHGFNVFFDALGGGDTLEALINGLEGGSWVRIYGLLEGKPLKIEQAISLGKGVTITGYQMFNWWGLLPEE